MCSVNRSIERCEERFKEVTKLTGDLSVFPLTKETHLQVKTDKDKSDEFGEVFTPLWLVDEMLGRVSDFDWKLKKKTTMDLCAGYGQFTIRMLRKKYSLLGEDFNFKQFKNTTHYFNEFQLSSSFKLLHIFGRAINLFIGHRIQNSISKNPMLFIPINGILFTRSPCNNRRSHITPKSVDRGA